MCSELTIPTQEQDLRCTVEKSMKIPAYASWTSKKPSNYIIGKRAEHKPSNYSITA